MKWLNREFGYRLTPRDLDGPRPALDEHELEWHLVYAGTFGDPDVLEKMRKHRDRFQRKGVFSALYELGSEE